MILPPKQKTILVPEGGWKESTYYVVDAAYGPDDPIHRAIFHSGFLNGRDGSPGDYAEIWCANYDEAYRFESAHYLKVVREIGRLEDNG